MKNGGAITADVGAPSDEPLDYQQRKEIGQCTYPGCPDPARDDAGTCAKHGKQKARALRRLRRKRAKLARRLLAKRIAKKLCLRCGARRLSGEEHCAKCLVVAGDIAAKAELACRKSRSKKADRIEANTSIDRDGRSRYRGTGKRGRQSVAAIDEKDLEYALDALQRMKSGLAFATSAATAQLPRLQKQNAINAALALGDQCCRFVEEVLGRHGHFGPVDPEPSKIGR